LVFTSKAKCELCEVQAEATETIQHRAR